MHLLVYFLRRVLQSIPIVIGVTLVIFLLFNVAGTDPAIAMLGKQATGAQIAVIHKMLGLDKPFLVQYLRLLRQLFTLDFGRSWTSKEPVLALIGRDLWTTLSFTLPGLVLSNMLAILVGLVAAMYRGRWPDRLLVFLTIVMRSISALSYILFAQWFFAFKLDLFPLQGYNSDAFMSFLPYVRLPVLITVFLALGYELRLYRGVLMAELDKSYVRAARAKGLSEQHILLRHVLPNAMIPIVTNVMLSLPNLFMGGIMLERFFSLPGLASVMTTAVSHGDFPVIKAMVILSALSFVGVNIFTDMLYTFVDPRIEPQ